MFAGMMLIGFAMLVVAIVSGTSFGMLLGGVQSPLEAGFLAALGLALFVGGAAIEGSGGDRVERSKYARGVLVGINSFGVIVLLAYLAVWRLTVANLELQETLGAIGSQVN